MAFDRKHYRTVKKFMGQQLNNRPWCCQDVGPVEWAKTFIPLITDCVKQEDYEGAQATSDAIREFLNQFLKEPIPADITLKLT